MSGDRSDFLFFLFVFPFTFSDSVRVETEKETNNDIGIRFITTVWVTGFNRPENAICCLYPLKRQGKLRFSFLFMYKAKTTIKMTAIDIVKIFFFEITCIFERLCFTYYTGRKHI